MLGLSSGDGVAYEMGIGDILSSCFAVDNRKRRWEKECVEFGHKWEKDVVQVRVWKSGTVRRVERFKKMGSLGPEISGICDEMG